MPADFGELRSLMNDEALDRHRREKLWTLLKTSFAEDEERYTSEWRPYLEGFPRHFKTPLATLEQPR